MLQQLKTILSAETLQLCSGKPLEPLVAWVTALIDYGEKAKGTSIHFNGPCKEFALWLGYMVRRVEYVCNPEWGSVCEVLQSYQVARCRTKEASVTLETSRETFVCAQEAKKCANKELKHVITNAASQLDGELQKKISSYTETVEVVSDADQNALAQSVIDNFTETNGFSLLWTELHGERNLTDGPHNASTACHQKIIRWCRDAFSPVFDTYENPLNEQQIGQLRRCNWESWGQGHWDKPPDQVRCCSD